MSDICRLLSVIPCIHVGRQPAGDQETFVSSRSCAHACSNITGGFCRAAAPSLPTSRLEAESTAHQWGLRYSLFRSFCRKQHTGRDVKQWYAVTSARCASICRAARCACRLDAPNQGSLRACQRLQAGSSGSCVCMATNRVLRCCSLTKPANAQQPQPLTITSAPVPCAPLPHRSSARGSARFARR